METTSVTIQVPTAEKDLIDAALKGYADRKAKSGALFLTDELPAAMKIGGEIAELKKELTLKGSIPAVAYLICQIATL